MSGMLRRFRSLISSPVKSTISPSQHIILPVKAAIQMKAAKASLEGISNHEEEATRIGFKTERDMMCKGGTAMRWAWVVVMLIMLIALNPLNVGTLWAATINAASCSQADVNSAITSAVDGDTVIIPAGTCTWTTQLTALSSAKAITVQGAGIDRTIIVDNVSKAGGGLETVLFPVSVARGKTFRLTGMTFQGLAQDTQVFNKGTVVLSGTEQDFRLDHLKFTQPGTSAIRLYGHLYGVVDHCNFDLSNFKQGINVQHNGWNGYANGDGSFADITYLGTNRAIYIEDNTFLGAGAAGAGPFDFLSGGRFVFRYNTVTNDTLAVHGPESGGRVRGGRTHESFHNTSSTKPLLFPSMYMRGGVGVIYRNTITGYKYGIDFADVRAQSLYNPWGQGDGSSVYDGKQQANGYPCIDQVGWGTSDLLSGDPPTPVAWPHQIQDPVYVWSNTFSVTNATVNSEAAQVQPGRDYILDTPKPGYTAYTYPHPLVSGTAALPKPPANLQVK